MAKHEAVDAFEGLLLTKPWGPPGCVVCDRTEAAEEVLPNGRRWWLCNNPGCRALIEHVVTIGDLAEIRRAGS